MRRLFTALAIAAMITLPSGSVSAQADSAEVIFWQSVQGTKDPVELEAYLQAYPKGKFAPLARIRLKKLKGGEPAASGRPKSVTASDAPPADANRKRAEAAIKPREKEITVELGARPNDPSKVWLGVKIFNLYEEVAAAFSIPVTKAVLVGRVTKGSAADTAGIVPGNVILSIDGVSTPDTQTLVRRVGEHAPGDKLVIKLVELAKTPAELVQILRRKAKESDDGILTNSLAQMYASGRLVPEDKKEAFRLYKLAVDKGYAAAMTNLGSMYAYGHGVTKDDAEAVRWYRKAVEKGRALAMNYLGVMYEDGRGVAKDPREAVRWYRKAAEKGSARAMTYLGFMYYEGKGVTKDYGESVKWSRKAAEKGDALGMSRLGFMYVNGRGVTKDYGEAVRWFRKAAEKGFAPAMASLGHAYKFGKGVKKDRKEADRWDRKAKEARVSSKPGQKKDTPALGIGDLKDLGTLD